PSRPAENSPHHPMASPAPSPQGTLSPHEQGTAGPEAEAVVPRTLPSHARGCVAGGTSAPLLPAASGTAQLGGPCAPSRGGPP
ncbi:unnamed protein product, partial [Bubo scandiacus]